MPSSGWFTTAKRLPPPIFPAVKELLTYDELTLNEIADRLGYSSAAYLSTQFKQITGLTPSAFKRSKGSKRRGLDEL